MTPSSPRQTGFDPELPPRSHPINISPPALSPTRSTSAGPSGHTHRHGSTSMAGRTYRDREDPESARERQRQQDIDSAMSMSRARSGSVTAPDVSPGIRPSLMRYPSTSPIEERMLSEVEEDDMDRARSAAFRIHDDAGSDDGRHTPPHMHDHEEERGEGMMDGVRRESLDHSSGYDSHARLLPDRQGDHSEGMGHSRHARHLGRHAVHDGRNGLGPSHFDFGPMEEFAGNERRGFESEGLIGSPSPWDMNGAGPSGSMRRRDIILQGSQAGAEGSNEQLDGDQAFGTGTGAANGEIMERTATVSAYGDEEQGTAPKESSAEPFQRRRQRKLSQSNPVQRRQGKLAIFEGFGLGGDDPAESSKSPSTAFKAPRQPKNLNGGAQAQGFVPFTDASPGHDRPYRFSFYSNCLPVTIHARTLAELPAEGQSFEDLFKGNNKGEDRPVDDGVEGTDYGSYKGAGLSGPNGGADPNAQIGTKTGLLAKAAANSGNATPQTAGSAPGGGGGEDLNLEEDPEAATWWLDVLSPTDDEMRMLSKVFGIHPLTTEDILLEETREKIELFRNYYLVCFRSFDQDPYSQTYLEPLNMYIIVFREGTLSFHFRGTPHPQNVRRRIKHLKDYISVTSDWISYALIDDITDAFGPLIQSIEYEVDSIDELVLILKDSEQSDMLRRIGTCRKKVMGLLRLMGNKADVVKGLAKRCNEQWLVAPKSDIGLYLSDIQDHLITMTQNLNHYEKILSRSHSNYLAQISIEMTDANNQINDVLSKLTALGTVLIPMNLVTGLWGMNVHVPGEDIKTGYAWFGGILGGLALFACLGAFATYKCFVR